MHWRDSCISRALVQEGQINEARRILLWQGRSRFGEPPPETVAYIQSLANLETLEELCVCALHAKNWVDLLGLNGTKQTSAQVFVKGWARGRAEQARRTLFLLGKDRLGDPPADVLSSVNALADVEMLEELTLHLHEATSWDWLLNVHDPGWRDRLPKKKRGKADE